MKRLREGNPTDADIAYLNTRVINGTHQNSPTDKDLPAGIAYAVYANRDRTAINNGLFAEHIKQTHSTDKNVAPPMHTLVIRSDDLKWQTSKKPFGLSAKHTLWSECGDSHVKTMDGRTEKFVDTYQFCKVCGDLYRPLRP